MKIWAHRGCSYRYPENTISSFSKCLEYKITGIELDIQLSKDGELVVIHDEKVDRTTDGTGYVKNMTLSELKELKIVSNPTSNIPYERNIEDSKSRNMGQKEYMNAYSTWFTEYTTDGTCSIEYKK